MRLRPELADRARPRRPPGADARNRSPRRMSVCVLGSINLDIVCRVAELPHPGETIMALDVQRFPGGKGANQAVASAHWGAQTAMIGVVGHDDAGEELLAHLVSAGIDTSGIFRLS